MWAGFGNAAVCELERLTVDRPKAEIAEAAWALALWSRSAGDNHRALEHLAMQRSATPPVRRDPLHLLVLTDVLLRLDRSEEADIAIHEAVGEVGEIAELCFCAANIVAMNPHLPQPVRDRLRLTWLNKPLNSAWLAPVELKDQAKALTLDNIAAPAAANCHADQPKISVLMAAYNAENTIAFAIESVLGQSWSNLELVVVDDGSDDGTWHAVKALAARDPRVRPMRHERNRGAYAARNTALALATGDFVTVHDADDWSHPAKLALQALSLMQNGEVANVTKQIRVHRDMRVYVKPDGSTILDCYPSLMMPRAVIAELGGWDDCRMGADDELWKRLLTRYRCDKVVIKELVPLSLHLYRDESLTSQPDIGAGSLYYGARRQYREAYRHWHRLELSKAKPDFAMRPGERRFPMPHICGAGPKRRLQYDVLFVSDLSGLAARIEDHVGLICAVRNLGLRCAVFHWPRLEFAGRDIALEVRKLLHDGVMENIVAGEDVSCRLAVVNDAAILDHLPDTMPKIKAGAAMVVATDKAALTSGRKKNAASVFAVAPRQATEVQVKEALRELRRRPSQEGVARMSDQVGASATGA